ncbi:MAG: hypothetical protein HY657_10560 [Acidobacteria bacterium]|nr:hypothetical protein [Acidobacteriota bacterium]
MLHRANAPLQPPTGLIARGMTCVRQFLCGLHGHDALLHFEQGRLSLQCTSCGYQTPGWDLKSAAPRPEHAKETPRRVVGLPLTSQRRVA